MEEFNHSDDTRCGFVSLLGAPNAGKSTFTNAVLKTKIAIVTHKVQTTRARMLGIRNEDDTQIVFVDTPGVFQPKKRIEKSMVKAAWQGAGEADIILFIVDGNKSFHNKETQAILEKLRENKPKAVLLINKIDTIKRDNLLKLLAQFAGAYEFEQQFLISAERSDGTEDVVKYLAKNLPKSSWHYPADQLSDMPMRSMAAEITREKVFLKLHDELPYDIFVETEKWEEKKDGSIKIDQVIYVKRDSQKRIVLGAKGAQIKEIGELAREELKEVLDCKKVHLFLFVKVRENWEDQQDFYRQWGLDYHA